MIIFSTVNSKGGSYLNMSQDDIDMCMEMVRDQREDSGMSKEEIEDWMDNHKDLYTESYFEK